MRLRSIDSKGMVTIQFSKPLMQIANFSLVEERQAISFLIYPSGPESQSARVVSWKVAEWGKNFIKIQLNIKDADKISLGQVSYDQIEIFRIKINSKW
jgi:hypothetical protein